MLESSNYDLTSDANDDYNCAAWAAHDTTAKWWPLPVEDAPEYYWPNGAVRDDSLNAFVDGYGRIGFQVCDNADLEEGVEKIAVYASRGNNPQHVARQLPSGRWTSKLGPDEDIEHGSLRDLQAGQYGYPVLFMRRSHVQEETG